MIEPLDILIKNKCVRVGYKDVETKQFLKNVDIKKHLLRYADAWGVDYKTFADELLPENYTMIFMDGSVKYTTTAERFAKDGFMKKFDEYGLQIFLSRKYFENDDGRTLKLL